MNTKLIGAMGEQAAARYLRQNGYEVLSGNFKTNTGEIDIVVLKEDVICFVEVKTRSNNIFSVPADAVDRKKEENIKSAAAAYINKYKLKNEFRYDIVEVYLDEKHCIKDIKHIINAF